MGEDEFQREEAVLGVAVDVPVVGHGGEAKLEDAVLDELSFRELELSEWVAVHEVFHVLGEVRSCDEGPCEADHGADLDSAVVREAKEYHGLDILTKGSRRSGETGHVALTPRPRNATRSLTATLAAMVWELPRDAGRT